MKKIGIILMPLVLAACTEQEVLAPVEPITPDGDVLIVPGLSMDASGSDEATTRGVTTYPYLATNVAGKKSIIVAKDADGAVTGMTFHERWEQTPYHEQRTTDPRTDISPRFEVAQTDAGPIEMWYNENGLCKAPWRRPTQDELILIRKWDTELEITHLANTTYWTSTKETGMNNRVGVRPNFTYAGWAPNSSSYQWLTRCVRDDIYPYVTTNAESKKSVIVSQDEYGTSGAALHAPWAVTPQHVHTNTVINSTSYRFEVAQTQTTGTWKSTNGDCQSPWRMPTHEELMVIYKVRAQLELSTALTSETYWSASETAEDAAKVHILNFNNTTNGYISNDPKTLSTNHTRCIRDFYDNFPDSPGSNVATLWGYTSTNALGTENLVPPTAIANTATGFALATPYYYPADGKKMLYFYAHAPHGGTTTTGDNAYVTYPDLGQKDVMWGKDDRGIGKNSNPAQQGQPFFQFQHKLMQLKFKLVADATYETGKTVTNITVKSVNTSAKMMIKDGATTFSVPGTISIAPTADNVITTAGITLKEQVMIEPKPTVTLSVTAGGVTYPDITITLKGTEPGKAGKSHLITLTLKRNLIVPAASMAAWTTGGSADVGVI